MIDRKQLLADTKAQVKKLEADLREVTAEGTELGTQLRGEHAAAFDATRTGWSDKEWIDDRITQAAVAWVLAGVFVRFLEDNNLVAEARLAGAGSRFRDAQDAKERYFRDHPADSDVDFLRWVFEQVARHPATSSVFDKQHNPLWQLPISGDAARELIEFWRRIDPNRDNALVHDFADPNLDTRFLGDLYQDLSDHAKKTYALLQTPEFVEEFILDRTLDPAIEEFGLDQATVIDPTCGSGHFLLGSFNRLLRRWREQEPGTDSRELVQRSLHAVHGVDINPFAVAIAKFRLTIAATVACGITQIADAPAFELNLAVGDSLLHGHTTSRLDVGAAGAVAGTEHWYATEDAVAARAILNKRYAAVVGNPPYITVKDKALREAYRHKFRSCHKEYALSVPFMERFFDLASEGIGGRPSGFVGKITSNSFATRAFGRRLVEEFLSTVDLNSVVDTSGADIPGHGTPTVLVFGRNRAPSSENVYSILGIRGEPASSVASPKHGFVWDEIVRLWGSDTGTGEYVAVERRAREKYSSHPWTLSGGGANVLRERIESVGEGTIGDLLDMPVGTGAQSNSDEVFFRAYRESNRSPWTRPAATGDDVRNWDVEFSNYAFFPYGQNELAPLGAISLKESRRLWPFRTSLWSRITFAGGTYREQGRMWWEWHQVSHHRVNQARLIVVGAIATHNHFSLLEEQAVLNRWAPAITLADSSKEACLRLVAYLNSSTACFWLRQVCYPKDRSSEAWMTRYEFSGGKIAELPLLEIGALMPVARAIDETRRDVHSLLPHAIAQSGSGDIVERVSKARTSYRSARERLIALQEELDWQVYGLARLIDESPLAQNLDDVPDVQLGERAFEIVLARKMESGIKKSEWFVRHGSVPITDVPSHWPEWYRAVVERRIELIESIDEIALVEQPEYKRRWQSDTWDEMQKQAMQGWLLDRLEATAMWDEAGALTCARLADLVFSDPTVQHVAELWAGGDIDPVTAVSKLTADHAVPYLAQLRLKESGLAVRSVWERTWDIQRAEDAIDERGNLPSGSPDRLSAEQTASELRRVVGDIPKPPAYKQVDFLRASYWKLRGKLDVPKERFISYPGLETADDPSPVIGWAGWDNDQRAQALASLIGERERIQGWTGEQLVPLLAGLRELLPWLRQWHAEVDPQFRTSAADDFEALYEAKLHEHGLTESDLTEWRPPAPTRARRQKAKT